MPLITRPNEDEVRRRIMAFRKHESRDAMYRVATHLTTQFWNQPRELADGVGVLLFTWNVAVYSRYPLDLARLQAFVESEINTLAHFRARSIDTFGRSDESDIARLFGALLEAVAGRRRGSTIRRTPVGVVKALHMFAPRFFPLWDHAIAKAYECDYSHDPFGAYRRFMLLSQDMASHYEAILQEMGTGKTPLKVLDEYNYAKYTKGWR